MYGIEPDHDQMWVTGDVHAQQSADSLATAAGGQETVLHYANYWEVIKLLRLLQGWCANDANEVKVASRVSD